MRAVVLIYHGKSAKVDGATIEYYAAFGCQYELVGYKPKAYDCSGMTYEQSDARAKEVRRELTRVRFNKRAQVCAMELCRSAAIKWSAKKPLPRSKHKEVQQATFEGAALRRVTWLD